MYQILVLDYDEYCFGKVYSDGEIKHISDQSFVPKKHRKGGQSAKRYSMNRENSIVQWFKKINEMLKPIKGEIYLGISQIYYKRFCKYLSTDNYNKIIHNQSIEYSNLTGIYQYVNSLQNN